MVDVFDALADANRRTILELVAKQPLTTAAINKSLKLTAPVLDKHLKMLVKVELLSVTSKGKTNTYSLNRKGLAEPAKWFGKFGASFVSGQTDQLGENITNLLNVAADWFQKNVGAKVNLDIDVEKAGRELGKKVADVKHETAGKLDEVKTKTKKK